MIKRNIFIILIFSSPLFLLSQERNLEIEDFDKVFEVIIPDPGISQHFPAGVIYRDSAYNYMSNITDRSITLANGPFGFQFSPDPFDFATLNYNSLLFTKDNSTIQGSWAPRSFGSSLYDIKTHGDVQSIASDGSTFSELTSITGEGLVKVYRYSPFGDIVATFSVDGFSAVSDRRLKHDIAPMQRLLPKVLQLRPSNYVYNGFTKTSQGFIAQEVQAIFPHLVSEIDGHLAVNYTAFSTIAIQAIKEQQETIDSLNDQVQSLASRLTALEKAK